MRTTSLSLGLGLAAVALAQTSPSSPALARAATPKTCKKRFVTSELLQKQVKLEDILAGAQKLQDLADAHGGNRAFGGGGHLATTDWLYDTLNALDYYDVYKQPFTELFYDGDAKLSSGGADVPVVTMTYTPPGLFEDASVVAIPNLGCAASDFEGVGDLAGKVALISRGECTFAQKTTNAKTAGAAAAIIYNNAEGVIAGTLGEPFGDYVPVVGILQVDGLALKAKLEAGESVSVDLHVDTIVENRVNYNVIAETKEGDHDNVLILGGHSDSVFAGPGINDDGSGTIGSLVVAVALAKFKVKNAVRFAFWGAEEFGKLGSYYYIRQINTTETELKKIRAYLNFDMIASPNYMLGIYDGDGSAFNLTGPAGSDVIEKDFEDFYTANGQGFVPSEFSGRSDYAAFIENGIPSGGLFTGAEGRKTEAEAALFGGEAGVAYDINYHQAGDTIDNLNLDAFLLNTKSIANSVAKYAISFDSLPPVNLAKRRWSGDREVVAKRSGAHDHSHAHTGPCGANPGVPL